MTLSSALVAEIVHNDEEYVRRISPSTICNNDDLRIIGIPASSFTAYRLSYVSPIELSLSSKVVLLGGIPQYWVRERLKGFWRTAWKISRRGFRGNANRLFNYGYQDQNKRNQARRQRISDCDCNRKPQATWDDTQYRKNPGAGRKNKSTSASPLSLATGNSQRKRSNTLPVVRTRASLLRKSKAIQRKDGHNVLKGKTRATLPSLRTDDTIANHSKSLHSSGYSSDDSLAITIRSTDDSNSSPECYDDQPDHAGVQFSINAEESLLDDYNISQKSATNGKNGAPNVKSSIFDDSEANLKHENDYKLSSVELEARPSDSSAPERLLAITSTVETTPVSFISSPCFSTSTHQTNDGKGSKIHFTDQETQKVARAYTKDKRRHRHPIVRLKPSCNSGYAEPLRIMVPEPDQRKGSRDEHVYKKHFKAERLVMRQVGHAGGKAKTRMKKGISSFIRTDYFISSPFLRGLKCGKIILMEKMLVMVKCAVNKKDPVISFSQEESIDTRISERWKEYIVVARSTGKGDSSILLQFYRRRHIPVHVNRQKDLTYGTSLDFQLDKHCLVGIYSNLDKSIYIQKPVRKESNASHETSSDDDDEYSSLKIYILKCSTLISSGKWYNLLRGATQMRDKLTQISLKIPEADISMDMNLRDAVVKELIKSENEIDDFKLCVLRRGYRVLQRPLMRFLIVSIFEELKKADLSEVVQKWEFANIILGCSYKHYDMLQWCSNSSIRSFFETFSLFKSCVLEFRPYIPTPRQALSGDGCILVEPVPIEGFLIRLTNRIGKEGSRLRKLYFRPSYFFTNDNLLFFSSCFKACPPSPSKELDMSSLQKGDRFDSLPNVCEQDPYPLDLSSHISWLKGELTAKEFESNDLYAWKCFSRRVDQILKAEGVINLCEIEEIHQGASSDFTGSEIKFRALHFAKRSFWYGQAHDVRSTAASILYIVTQNRLVLKLMAPSPAVCQEWTLRLRSLVSYWKARKDCDIKNMWNLKIRNMQQLRITNEEESNINDSTPKWIIDSGSSDASLYNVNALCQLRPILYKGVLYQKPKKHSTFTKYLVVLVPGFLILYKPFKRTVTGFSREIIDYKHYLTLSVADCYLYSGATSKVDLLNRRDKIQELASQSKSLPRAYPDGWRSLEDESARCFTLWFGKKRAKLAASRKAGSEKGTQQKFEKPDSHKNFESNPKVFQMVTRLGVSGKSMVFMARSRQERNLWVLSISSEIERLNSMVSM
ncbi:hypothetical protein HG536_0C02060 [Torulaspora globosa]|uniref:PH domain-containing protein n=1 Tax=Torulaspora globosa TaxID=48254 RepID=A0A7G3ZEV1_9SACH|nr:uncharacterized protein HG536_0C02060 [Torulaspora globosa]QLL32037.1 hypothetical protein HG536_0C02060 [Torulaspora globosa]